MSAASQVHDWLGKLGQSKALDRVSNKILHRAEESVFGSRDMEGSVLCNGFELRSGLRRFINETLSIFGNTPWSHQTKRISALLLVVLAAVVAPGLSAQTYVPYQPPIVTTASTLRLSDRYWQIICRHLRAMTRGFAD